jgi:hypothetical protein
MWNLQLCLCVFFCDVQYIHCVFCGSIVMVFFQFLLDIVHFLILYFFYFLLRECVGSVNVIENVLPFCPMYFFGQSWQFSGYDTVIWQIC